MSKELIAYTDGFLVRIRFDGGGEVPEDLKGLYTSKLNAQEAIDAYLSTRRVRKPKDGKRES